MYFQVFGEQETQKWCLMYIVNGANQQMDFGILCYWAKH